MTRKEFDRRFAATGQNTEGYNADELAAINDAVFAKLKDEDADEIADNWKSWVDHLFAEAYSEADRVAFVEMRSRG